MSDDNEKTIKYLVELTDKTKGVFFCEFDPKKMMGKQIVIHLRDKRGLPIRKSGTLHSIIEEIKTWDQLK